MRQDSGRLTSKQAPWARYATALDGCSHVGSFIEGPAKMTLPQVQRELALWFGEHSARNRIPLERSQKAFLAGQFALLIELTGLILTIGDAINV